MEELLQGAAALLDFVRANNRGLFDVSEKTATLVIELLADERVEPHQLLSRVINSDAPNKLFRVLFTKVEADDQRRLALLDAVVAIQNSTWIDGTLSPKCVAGLFTTRKDFEYVLTNHRDAISRPGEKVFLRFYFDEYWRVHVRWYIVSGDFRRAWDELRKTKRGYYIGSKESGKRDPKLYRYGATSRILREIVQELYSAMIEKNALVALPSGKASQDAVAMSHRLADHFRTLRNAQRQKKVERACACLAQTP
jgi:hypothetical protein